MISLNISLPQLQLFFLVFIRVGAILMFIPVFDSKSIPLFFKIALALATSIVLFPMLDLDPLPVVSNVFLLGVRVIAEGRLGEDLSTAPRVDGPGSPGAGQSKRARK